MEKKTSIALIAIIVALGGFLMGFDASVISGVNGFIVEEFDLTEIQLGWAVSSLTLVAAGAMLIAGPISNMFGRKKVLYIAAALYFISAIGSALAPTYDFLVYARMLGGVGVGASLIIAPMYIAEIAPADRRGFFVSFNQLNIVIGISVAFFTNLLINNLSKSDTSWAMSLGFKQYTWRWMLGLEALPAFLYFISLYLVPRSPRWLAMKGEFDAANKVLKRIYGSNKANNVLTEIKENLNSDKNRDRASFGDLFKKALLGVLIIGLVIGILQQITGINAVFFYAPMIFEQSGIGRDSALTQAVLVGLVNLAFTVVALFTIDRIGRKPLLIIGVGGIVVSMLLLSYSFGEATYKLTNESLTELIETAEKERLQEEELSDESIEKFDYSRLTPILDIQYQSDVEFKTALKGVMSNTELRANESQIIAVAGDLNSGLILFSILFFIASFAVSVGPVMWVLFSELFPNRIRGLAISTVGFVNSMVSFSIQFVFPWELQNLGASITFMIFGLIALLGLVFIFMKVPETKGKSLEELEAQLVKS